MKAFRLRLPLGLAFLSSVPALADSGQASDLGILSSRRPRSSASAVNDQDFVIGHAAKNRKGFGSSLFALNLT